MTQHLSRKMMTRLRRFTVAALLGIAFLALTAWITLTWVLTRPPSYSPRNDVGEIVLREWQEHDAIYRATEFPYVLSLSGQTGALEYVGALHTSDAEEPQLKEIEQRWASFQPTVALCEGRARMFQFASRNETGSLSESELVRILAQQHSVPLFTLEPTYEAEVAGLLGYFDPRVVATYMTLRVYCSEASQYAGDKDSLALRLMRKRTNVEGLNGTFSTIAELDGYWQTEFPDEPDWRELQNVDHCQRLRNVGDVSRQVRGEHMVRTLTELVQNGERVFAVVGASHVIRQEPVLRRLLEPSSATNEASDVENIGDGTN